MGREGTFVSVFINICSMAITADTYRNRSGRQWTALNVAHCPASTKQHRSVGGLFDYRLNCLFGEYFGPAVITVNLVQSSRIWSMLFNDNKITVKSCQHNRKSNFEWICRWQWMFGRTHELFRGSNEFTGMNAFQLTVLNCHSSPPQLSPYEEEP